MWWASVTERSAEQYGVFGRGDLDELGVPPTAVRTWVRSGRIEKAAPGVWRIAGSPASWHQRLKAGLLSLGPAALVSHEAAAQLHGFERTPPDRVEFLAPESARNSRLGERVHTSSFWEPLDRTAVDGWPVTSATRTVLDLAMLHPGRRRIEAAIESAVRSRASSPVVLRRRLATLRGRGRWGCALVDQLLTDSGGESVLERTFLALMRRAGLPRPETQFRIGDRTRTVARVDFVWQSYRIVVEVSGGLGHSTPTERTKDAQRRNELLDMGWKVYEYTWHHVEHEPAYVIGTMIARLRSAGWAT
jgi:very-short-patch-repair endonuclease